MKTFTPIILIVVAVALFFWQIQPLYTNINELRAQSAEYDNALQTADELESLRAELADKLASFPQTDLQRLETFLPNHVDNVRTILDVSAIADKYDISIQNIKTAEVSAGTGGVGARAYNIASLGFSFDASYSAAANFLRDLETSLRLVDVQSLDMKVSTDKSAPSRTYEFTVTLYTYWIPKK